MRKLSLIMAIVLLLGICLVACDAGKGGEYLFAYNGQSIHIGDDGNTVAAALGAYTDYIEEDSCGGEGPDKTFVYPGFRFYTVMQNGVDRIVKIVLTDDSVATPQGIKIGDAKSAVVAAYGDSYTETADGGLIYTDGSTKLMFGIRDGVVTAIHYIEG
ncbi:MAG: hypothetical protein E7581_07120 [Ruminococcaceae bacterium]|nr:hypothetical protein [Oscillospiraceae bacterium]